MTPPTPRSSRFLPWSEDDVPIIDNREAFHEVVKKLRQYIVKTIDAAYSYEQLRTTAAGQSLRTLVLRLSEDCHYAAIVAALLAARYIFDSKSSEDPNLAESRALACELAASEFVTFLSERELIDHLLYELPVVSDESDTEADVANSETNVNVNHETRPLLEDPSRSSQVNPLRPPPRTTKSMNLSSSSLLMRDHNKDEEELSTSMSGMNALEIAAVANAKRFLSQKPVQAVIEDIWNGNIIFWDSLSAHAKKGHKFYNQRTADPFSRLRVPKYQKAFQVAFFAAFLIIYYAVLVQRNPQFVTATEGLLYVWIAAFAYDEFGELRDAGFLFYQTDFWSVWDLAIILVCSAFFIMRIIGLVRDSNYITDMAFDILSMAALFLVPRICSVASLNPYFGSLLPVLKEMTTAFAKFLPVVFILYLGFLTTFTMLARDRLTLKEVSRLLVAVFFGSSYLGFDFAVEISPIFGYTLMVIFVALTNILLITALVSLVSNSLTEVMAHAREEYLFQYSIYVLESCTSRRLTYFIPPTNLIPLLFIRPLRLVLPSDSVRGIRVLLLRAVSIPFVALIWCYEGSSRLISGSARPPTLGRTHTRPLCSSRPSYGFSASGTLGMASAPKNASPHATYGFEDASISTGSSMKDNTDLIALVQRLSVQVEELTAIVAGRKTD